MFFNKNDETKDKVVDEVLSSDSFNNLNLDLIDLDLKVETGNKFEVHYCGSEDEKPSVELKDDTLEIEEPRVERKHGKFWRKDFIEVNIVSQSDSGALVVTVPDGHQLGTVKVSSVSGDTDFKSLNLDSLVISVVSGDVSLRIVQTDEVKLTTTSGDIDLKEVTVKQGKAQLVSGDFTLKNSLVLDQFKASTTSGDNLVEDVKAAQYQLSTLSGDNSLFGKNEAAAEGDSTNNAGTIILSTLSGDNTVK